MVIMQTVDAKARRDLIESKGLGKVIWTMEHGDDVVAVQYHPKGVKGLYSLFIASSSYSRLA